ncbi:sigma-70 family RNA polymerase sigma factor [Streptomyces sp. NBC_00996]|uniref:sigma-70 family RNA polymerase sigma factor n=1 Tax=Streptomyces sp. NBC_00996 TaxID=2903710 RepID=UPI00386A0FE2|nr:sigma-70 family RNA polymerase sigma factor [Streptomyces sp. NBC_00996]
MTRVEEFEELRPLLFSIAYRILGSVSEAEDAVQETWLRYELSPTRASSPKAFLSAVVTRVSIDVLRSARLRREEYVGPWFPEPLLTDPYEDPERSAELADSLSMASLLLLERLSPLERAVFVLREVFAFGFPEIASAVGRSEAACRQLAVRARRHMDEGRPRFEADRREREELAGRFFDAFREGKVEQATRPPPRTGSRRRHGPQAARCNGLPCPRQEPSNNRFITREPEPGESDMIRIGIIIGSTRPGRNGDRVAQWVRDLAAEHAGAAAEFGGPEASGGRQPQAAAGADESKGRHGESFTAKVHGQVHRQGRKEPGPGGASGSQGLRRALMARRSSMAL